MVGRVLLEVLMIQIRFKASGANSVIGGFSSGDLARVSEAFAKHLVEEACVAEYVKASEPVKPAKPVRKAKAAAEVPVAEVPVVAEPVVAEEPAAVTPAPTFDDPAAQE
jgi:hypothetical protein